MEAFALIIFLLSVPATCSAHSGTLINAVSNYLPILMPMLLGAVAAVREFVKNFSIREFVKRFFK